MEKNKEVGNILLTIAAITAGSAILWIGLLVVIWVILREAGSAPDFWEMTGALSTAVAVAAIIVAGYVAYRELAEGANSRHLEVADKLFEELNAPEKVADRRWVFQNLPPDPEEGIRSLTPEGQAAVKGVLNSLDRVAFLTQSGWIPEEMVMPWMNPMIVKAWLKIGPYVAYESERRREPDYYMRVKELAERCQSWREEHLPGAEITWLDDAL